MLTMPTDCRSSRSLARTELNSGLCRAELGPIVCPDVRVGSTGMQPFKTISMFWSDHRDPLAGSFEIHQNGSCIDPCFSVRLWWRMVSLRSSSTSKPTTTPHNSANNSGCAPLRLRSKTCPSSICVPSANWWSATLKAGTQ